MTEPTGVLPMSVNLMATGPIGQIVELAQVAESVGCCRCWAYDEGLVTRDVYVTLTAIAAATERIRLGPGITNPYVRHPGATAAAIASLDEVSGGRAFLGLGAGGGLTLNPLAIDRRRPVANVAEMITSLRALWAGDTVTTDGPTFGFHNARLGYGRPDIEIIVAGRGPRMVELGAAQADGFYLGYLHKSLLGPAIETLRAGAATHGRSFRIVYSTMVATTEADLETARVQLSFRLVDSPPEVRELIGMTSGDEMAIRTALSEGGPSLAAQFVNPDWVPSFVIAGTPAEAGAELRSLMREHGIDEFQVPITELDDGAARIEAMAGMFR